MVSKLLLFEFFQLQYLSCKLVILREHYRTAQKEHLPCYAYIIGTLEYLKGLLDRCRFIHKSGSAIAPAGLPTEISVLALPSCSSCPSWLSLYWL